MSTPDKNALLAKVRKMLALAESEAELGHTEASENHMAMAATMMAKYGIDEALASARADVRQVPANKIFDVEAPYAGIKVILFGVVARALHCEAIQLSTHGANSRIHVFGFETDIEQAQMLYTSLLLQMTRAESRERYPSWITGRRLMAERRSFFLGFIGAVRPRLEAAYAVAVAEADGTGTKGKELVLASRDVAVKAALHEVYPEIRQVRVTTRGRSGGAGAEAGERANIHDRKSPTGAGNRSLTR